MKLKPVQEFIHGVDEYQYDLSDSTGFYDTEEMGFVQDFVEAIGIVEDFDRSGVEEERVSLSQQLVGMQSVQNDCIAYVDYLKAWSPGFLHYVSTDSDE